MEPDEQNLALSQGLLGLGAGLLSGSFGHYGAFGPALGQGVQGFTQNFGNAMHMSLQRQQMAQQQKLQNAQIANYDSEVAKRKYEQDEQQRLQTLARGADQFADGRPPMQQVPSMGPQIAQQAWTQPSMAPPVNGVATAPEVDVPGQRASNLLNSDWHLKRAQYLYEHGDPKGAVEASKRAQELRAEDRNTTKDDMDKPLEGVSGVTFNPMKGIFKEDGHQVTAARVQEIKLAQQRAGATQMQTNVNSYLPASEEAQRDFIKSTRATYDQLKQAPVMIDSIEKAKALIPGAKGFMGPGGENLLDATKFLNNRLGMGINTQGVKDAEELRTRIFFNIMDNLKKMDAQPSQQQQQIMQEALGKLGTDPSALPRVLDAFEDVIRGKVDLHNNEVQGAMKRMVKFPYDPLITLPPKKAAGGGMKRYNPATGKIE